MVLSVFLTGLLIVELVCNKSSFKKRNKNKINNLCEYSSVRYYLISQDGVNSRSHLQIFSRIVLSSTKLTAKHLKYFSTENLKESQLSLL